MNKPTPSPASQHSNMATGVVSHSKSHAHSSSALPWSGSTSNLLRYATLHVVKPCCQGCLQRFRNGGNFGGRQVLLTSLKIFAKIWCFWTKMHLNTCKVSRTSLTIWCSTIFQKNKSKFSKQKAKNRPTRQLNCLKNACCNACIEWWRDVTCLRHNVQRCTN